MDEEIFCRGDWALGTACGKCQRCFEAAPAEIKRLHSRLSRALEEGRRLREGIALFHNQELGSALGALEDTMDTVRKKLRAHTRELLCISELAP